MRKIIMVVMLLFLIILPAMAATNSYTKTLTTTTELSNGAYYSGFIISSDRLALASGAGEYISPAFTAVNLTSGDVNYNGDDGYNEFEYGWLYSNSQWLNSTDGRHVTGGHAYYNILTPSVPVAAGYSRPRDSR
jgi:hypothetical protein